MRHYLFEDKDYQIKATFKKRKNIRDPAAELARLFKKRHGGSFGGSGHKAPDLRQRCTTKMQYSSSIEAHKVQLEKYLSREGTAIDGGPAELFGTDIKEYQKNMDKRNFRIFLSPESSGVDIKKLAEQFIQKLEKQTGYILYWEGACHYNTAHPHAHLLINGKDKNGKEIKFPKDMVKTFMRETSMDLCTDHIGKRSLKEVEIAKEKELSAPRWIKFDNHIHSLCGISNQINPVSIKFDRQKTLGRIKTLCKLNLCTYENGKYVFKKNWEDDLKSNGKYNTFLRARGELRYSDAASMKIFTGSQGLVTGKITKIYRTDGDASNNHAVILEGIDGKAYFIPLLKMPELFDSGKKSLLKEGELITIKTYESQTGRLTPLFIKKDLKAVQNEILKNRYSGKLATVIKQNSIILNGEYRTK